ncbi:hypothetical protein BLNAU_17369 [Blattamonas nauphoetae]|uniref:Uncharacterized protein n=1 Tax=Blattamonas nauphoetae TaxID=2049346 RepID=A0ABQ9X8J8_9EUKA|nr:hypothetical protein BLNAU_17369 [Blattamonas nauphoetae]
MASNNDIKEENDRHVSTPPHAQRGPRPNSTPAHQFPGPTLSPSFQDEHPPMNIQSPDPDPLGNHIFSYSGSSSTLIRTRSPSDIRASGTDTPFQFPFTSPSPSQGVFPAQNSPSRPTSDSTTQDTSMHLPINTPLKLTPKTVIIMKEGDKFAKDDSPISNLVDTPQSIKDPNSPHLDTPKLVSQEIPNLGTPGSVQRKRGRPKKEEIVALPGEIVKVSYRIDWKISLSTQLNPKAPIPESTPYHLMSTPHPHSNTFKWTIDAIRDRFERKTKTKGTRTEAQITRSLLIYSDELHGFNLLFLTPTVNGTGYSSWVLHSLLEEEKNSSLYNLFNDNLPSPHTCVAVNVNSLVSIISPVVDNAQFDYIRTYLNNHVNPQILSQQFFMFAATFTMQVSPMPNGVYPNYSKQSVPKDKRDCPYTMTPLLSLHPTIAFHILSLLLDPEIQTSIIESIPRIRERDTHPQPNTKDVKRRLKSAHREEGDDPNFVAIPFTIGSNKARTDLKVIEVADEDSDMSFLDEDDATTADPSSTPTPALRSPSATNNNGPIQPKRIRGKKHQVVSPPQQNDFELDFLKDESDVNNEADVVDNLQTRGRRKRTVRYSPSPPPTNRLKTRERPVLDALEPKEGEEIEEGNEDSTASQNTRLIRPTKQIPDSPSLLGLSGGRGGKGNRSPYITYGSPLSESDFQTPNIRKHKRKKPTKSNDKKMKTPSPHEAIGADGKPIIPKRRGRKPKWLKQMILQQGEEGMGDKLDLQLGPGMPSLWARTTGQGGPIPQPIAFPVSSISAQHPVHKTTLPQHFSLLHFSLSQSKPNTVLSFQRNRLHPSGTQPLTPPTVSPVLLTPNYFSQIQSSPILRASPPISSFPRALSVSPTPGKGDGRIVATTPSPLLPLPSSILGQPLISLPISSPTSNSGASVPPRNSFLPPITRPPGPSSRFNIQPRQTQNPTVTHPTYPSTLSYPSTSTNTHSSQNYQNTYPTSHPLAMAEDGIPAALSSSYNPSPFNATLANLPKFHTLFEEDKTNPNPMLTIARQVEGRERETR